MLESKSLEYVDQFNVYKLCHLRYQQYLIKDVISMWNDTNLRLSIFIQGPSVRKMPVALHGALALHRCETLTLFSFWGAHLDLILSRDLH